MTERRLRVGTIMENVEALFRQRYLGTEIESCSSVYVLERDNEGDINWDARGADHFGKTDFSIKEYYRIVKIVDAEANPKILDIGVI